MHVLKIIQKFILDSAFKLKEKEIRIKISPWICAYRP